MFGGLKATLQAARSRLGSSIQNVIAAPATGDGTSAIQKEPVLQREKPVPSAGTPAQPTLV